jgi:hypothetical protein
LNKELTSCEDKEVLENDNKNQVINRAMSYYCTEDMEVLSSTDEDSAIGKVNVRLIGREFHCIEINICREKKLF